MLAAGSNPLHPYATLVTSSKTNTHAEHALQHRVSRARRTRAPTPRKSRTPNTMTAQTDQQHGFSGAPDQVLSRAHMVALNTSTPQASSVRVLSMPHTLFIVQARTRVHHRSDAPTPRPPSLKEQIRRPLPPPPDITRLCHRSQLSN
ncbi:unnamed protein product [Macrosiphum euphorbiae]|uniref:Uncharacterized protein n=2 Tax=Macrosiphum euphorbiae TaxID=13131 RepID=A0AAV0WFL4_9HEMI|nr:unnamed protein product [Macrosiphum euphorbiae]